MLRIIMFVLVILFVTSCDSGTEITTPVLPHNPVNEGWKAVENYEYSFNTKDLALLDDTIDENFFYFLPEEEWDDYNGDGVVDTSLTKEMYLEIITTLFSSYEVVELTLDGDGEYVWTGDSTGNTLQLIRSYQKRAYNWVGGQQEGFTENGNIEFLSKPDTAGSWRITGITETADE